MQCPHCRRAIGGPTSDGELRVRLAIVLVNPETGRVHGPCSRCKQDVTIAEGATAVKPDGGFDLVKPGVPLTPTRRRVYLPIAKPAE